MQNMKMSISSMLAELMSKQWNQTYLVSTVLYVPNSKTTHGTYLTDWKCARLKEYAWHLPPRLGSVTVCGLTQRVRTVLYSRYCILRRPAHCLKRAGNNLGWLSRS